MKKIIEYASIVVDERNLYELAEKVNEKISAGFQPYGYPCVAGASRDSKDDDGAAEFVVIQALVKFED